MFLRTLNFIFITIACSVSLLNEEPENLCLLNYNA